MVTAGALMFTMFVTPYEVGLNLATKLDALFITNCIVNFIYLGDIIVAVLPSGRQEGASASGELKYERRHDQLAKRYMMGWSLPIDVVHA